MSCVCGGGFPARRLGRRSWRFGQERGQSSTTDGLAEKGLGKVLLKRPRPRESPTHFLELYDVYVRLSSAKTILWWACDVVSIRSVPAFGLGQKWARCRQQPTKNQRAGFPWSFRGFESELAFASHTTNLSFLFVFSNICSP